MASKREKNKRKKKKKTAACTTNDLSNNRLSNKTAGPRSKSMITSRPVNLYRHRELPN